MKFSNAFPIVLLALSGCSSNHNEKQFEGFFTYGHETSVFRQCNDSKVFWLNGEAEVMRNIEHASLNLAEKRGKPYQDIYIQFSGFFEDRDPVGFEEETAGLIYINELIKYSEKQSKSCK